MRSATTVKNNWLILDGSPRQNGATAALLAAVPSDAAHFRCYDTPVLPCDDCRACRVTGRCAKRDMDALYEQIEQADVLVFATPLYNDNFPAPLKAVIDRCQVYWSRRFALGQRPPIARPKQVYLLTVGGAANGNADGIKRSLLPLLTVLNGRLVGEVHAANTDTREDLSAEQQAVARLFSEDGSV